MMPENEFDEEATTEKEDDGDIYEDDEYLEDLEDNDETSPNEAGFIQGYKKAQKKKKVRAAAAEDEE